MTIEDLKERDRKDVIDVLAEAFQEYPVFRYVLRDAQDGVYERHLRALIGFFVDARLMRGWPVLGIRQDGELAAAVLLSDPVFKERPEPLNAVYANVADEVGPDAIARMEKFESASAGLEPKSRTYFVGMIGVRPAHQGRGLGRHLMRHIEALSRARPESSGVTLTTELPANLRFYESLGYRVLGSRKVGDVETWFLHLPH